MPIYVCIWSWSRNYGQSWSWSRKEIIPASQHCKNSFIFKDLFYNLTFFINDGMKKEYGSDFFLFPQAGAGPSNRLRPKCPGSATLAASKRCCGSSYGLFMILVSTLIHQLSTSTKTAWNVSEYFKLINAFWVRPFLFLLRTTKNVHCHYKFGRIHSKWAFDSDCTVRTFSNSNISVLLR